jgi:hypothetical protein
VYKGTRGSRGELYFSRDLRMRVFACVCKPLTYPIAVKAIVTVMIITMMMVMMMMMIMIMKMMMVVMM